MRKINFIIILILLIFPTLTSCGGEIREALEGKKRSDQSDEFLVKKKNPLQRPPDMDKLPVPGENIVQEKNIEDNDIKDLLKIKNNENKNSSDDKSSELINNMLKKIE